MAKPVKSWQQKMQAAVELPPEVVLGLPKLVMIGSQEMVIQNHKGLLEYSGNRIRIRTNQAALIIMGQGMRIRFFDQEQIRVTGQMNHLEWSEKLER